MSLSGSLTGLSFSGISSGIDTQSIISQLLLLEQAPIQRLQARQAQLSSKLGLMSSFRAKLGSLSSSIGALAMPSAFKSVSATSSDSSVASITAGTSAALGVYDLSVFKLAQAHKIASAGQASATEALGLTGEIIVNGRVLTIEAGDSLRAVANKINGASIGVTANVIEGGEGNAFLSLTSASQGASGRIQLADFSGSVLSDLGLVDTSESIGPSFAFGSSTEPVGNLLGFTTSPSGSFALNGVSISVDFATDSLEDIASLINASGSGASATVESVSIGGVSKKQLSLSGVSSHTDADNLLHAIGVVQNGSENELVAAQDAEYKLDGVTLTSSSNTISGVIAGTTISLLKASPTGAQTTLSVERDTGEIRDKVNEFVTQFNGLIDFVRSNTSFDKDSFETGGLFGDPAVARVESLVSNVIFTQLQGNGGLLKSLGDMGITLDSDGRLEVDEAKLDSLLESNLDGLSNVFRSSGTTSVKELSFLGGTSKTKPSGATGYQVFITALGQKLSLGATVVQTGPLAQQEVLTFAGAALAGGSHEIVLDAGMTQTQIVDRINGDPKLKSLMTASIVGGKLQIDSKEFGTGAAFSVLSNVSTGGSGWGSGAVLQAAADVQGTINGEEAVGAGLVLTGKAGNPNTDGLQVRFNGNAIGSAGSVTFAQGVSDLMTGLIAGLTESTNGYLSNNDKALQDQIDGIAKQIAFKQEQVDVRRSILQARFNRMELAIAELQAQQARIAAFAS